MLEAVEKFWEETERHDHGLVSGQVVQATFDELHPETWRTKNISKIGFCAFRMEGLVKLQVVVVTFGFSPW